mmetsp:Transcript_12109/g.32770  ORF Transcript_12109/g.32770 Transcript_12109/m.32770 type:complete len:703 (+) Transcript_12109:53-2161(+)
MSAFYNDMAASVLRSDYTLYLIITYLTFFRLEELGFNEYRKFIESQEPDKMTGFLSYSFDVARLANSTKWDWIKLYDLDFVEETMLGPIEQHTKAANTMRVELIAKASGLAAEKEASDGKVGLKEMPKKPPTVAVSPHLTRPAPRAVPEPIRIKQEVVVGKEPTYLERTSLEAVQKTKAARLEEERERTTKKYAESNVQEFKLHETRSNLQRVRREVEEKRAKELDFDKDKRAPPVRMPREGATVKLNTAAILREDSLYKKKQEQEARQIQAYEAELRDSTEFHAWQTEMRSKDIHRARENVERTRVLAKLSAEEARRAIERQKEDNLALASQIKEESDAMMEQRALEVQMQAMMNRRLVEDINEVRDHAPREAEAKLLEQRRARRDEVKEDIEAKILEKEAELEQEQKEREDKVRQLKALSEVPRKHVKVFDPTESIGLGLLDEMSLVEMKERLSINKVRAEEIELEKRGEISVAKHKKQTDLMKRVENIKRIRKAAGTSNKEARERRKAMEVAQAEAEKQLRDEHNMTLLDTLDEKRRTRQAEQRELEEEEERRKQNQAFAGQNAHAAEELHFDELLKGAEREARTRQTEAQRASKMYEETKRTERTVVETTTAKRESRKKKLFAAKADELEVKRKDLISRQKEEIAAKKAAFLVQREKHRTVKEKLVAFNPYASTVGKLAGSRTMGGGSMTGSVRGMEQ